MTIREWAKELQEAVSKFVVEYENSHKQPGETGNSYSDTYWDICFETREGSK